MWCKKRHKVIVAILRPFFKLYFKLKYRCVFDKEKCDKEGSLILANHTTTMDPFLVGMVFDKNLYYMASMDLFEHKFTGKLIKFLVNPIPKEKSNKGDIAAIKNCIKVSKEKGNICIFPEGNRTLSGELGNIDYSIVKLVKLLKKPLILVNIIGGFGTDPRWGSKIRKGKMQVKVVKKYSYEEYKDMDNDELYNLIKESLYVDDYNTSTLYKSKNKAEYLERVVYICPICGKYHTLRSHKDYIYCSACNLKVKYSEDLTFSSENKDFKFKYLKDWYNYQLDIIKNKEYKAECIYENDIEVYEPRLYKSKKFIGEGKMKLYSNKLLLELTKENVELNFEDISGMTLLGKKKMNIYHKDKTYQVFKDERLNLLKYMHLYYELKNRKEGIKDGFMGL